MIADGQMLTTGENALLIIGSESAQLTLGENTAVTLPGSGGLSIIDVDRGWLRARLSTAADHSIRMNTDMIAVDASSATLTLQVSNESIDLSIEDGNAVLITPDGHHRASLAAGAAAKRERSDASPLLIRPARHHLFSEVMPLQPEVDDGQSKDHPVGRQSSVDMISPPESKAAGPGGRTQASPPSPLSTKSELKSFNDNDTDDVPAIAILPASNRKSPDGRGPRVTETVTSIYRPLPSSITKPAPSTSDQGPLNSIRKGAAPPTSPPPLSMQQKFDRLTEGLLDGLD
jgi:hypothetical protein